MARSDGYNTKTRQLILDYLIRNRQHAVSASNILEHLEAEGASPNPTTVYRYLDKLAGDQVDVFVNGLCIARGDVVVIDDNFGVRITEVLQKPELWSLTNFK